jgi:hypothetical protein
MALCGCTAEPQTDSLRTYSTRNQLNEYDKVKSLLPQLSVGMAGIDVLIILGSPASKDRQTWVYLPERPGFFIPAESLQVQFDRGRYIGHKFVPIVLGENLEILQHK